VHARVSTYQGEPAMMDDAAQVGREEVLPAAKQLAGFKGVLLLGDRESGKSISITLWEDENAMRDSEERANQLRERTAEVEGGTIESVERYEVQIFEMT
jgi:hypothetical protein